MSITNHGVCPCKQRQRQGEIQLEFQSYPSFYHCAVIFVVPNNHKVFLHILSEPDECFGYKVSLYDNYEIIPSNELTPRENFCRKTDKNKSGSLPDDFPRSFMTSTNYFAIQVDYKCADRIFMPLLFNVYYQHFAKEEDLYQGKKTYITFLFH